MILLIDIFQYALAFLLALGILVTFHEWGHYWVAKRLGVKIERFSVGFGNPIWSRKVGPDQTEFCIAPIPLGGYVKMLGDDDTDVPEHEAHRAFNRQSLKVRSAIVVAGPLANFILAILFYMLMYIVGVNGVKPVVGEVTEGGLADHIGLQNGHIIAAIDDEPMYAWKNVQQAILSHTLRDEEIQITVQDDKAREYVLYFDTRQLDIDEFAKQSLFDQLGFKPYQPPFPAKIARVSTDKPAALAGLQAGDEIIQIDGQPVDTWLAAAAFIQNSPDTALLVTVLRGAETLRFSVTPESVDGKGIIGIQAQSPVYPENYLVIERYGPLAAFSMGIQKTWDMTVLSLKMIKKMIVGDISLKNLSGPVTIAEFSGKTFQMGLVTYLSFLALVSLSLGIINLLPIPVLDGGHLFLYLIEWIKGGPLSEQSLFVFQRIGLVLLVLLMGLALFNDINRLLE
jgi:regulator of sigma E protease